MIAALVLVSEPALATQAHNAPEGLYAHQLAHVFFIISMGVLIYWLRERKLVQAVGWRYIQYAATCWKNNFPSSTSNESISGKSA